MISDFHGVPPLDLYLKFFDDSSKNPKGGPHENRKSKIVLEPRNSLCINVWSTQYHTPNFIQIGQREGKNQHTLYTLEATLTSPFSLDEKIIMNLTIAKGLIIGVW